MLQRVQGADTGAATVDVEDVPIGSPPRAKEVTTQEGGFPQAPPLAGNHEDLPLDAADDNGKPYGADVTVAANELHARAVKDEPQVTKDLQEALDATPGADRLEGLQYRVKEQTSLAKKIRGDLAEKGGIEGASNGVFDSIRYTAISEPGDYTANAQATIDALRAKGYTMSKVKNAWANPDIAYKGVNVQMISPNGVKVELQFHTPKSFDVKMAPEMHGIYDKQKLTAPGSPERQAYENEMIDYMTNVAKVEFPPGAETIA